MRNIIIIILLLLFAACLAQGRTITVGPGPGYDFNSIQAAINDANEGDTVLVYPGLYNEYINFGGKNITVQSTNPFDPNVVANTIINWGVVFTGTESSNCTLSGFKLNFPIWGGYTKHTYANISFCILTGIRLEGNAIRNCDGEIINCLIADNGPSGNAISHSIVECHGIIRNCTISHNSLGIFIGEGRETTIENSIIYYNGVQITVRDKGTLNISYSNIEGGESRIGRGEGSIVNWGPGNIDLDPCFVRVGDWFNNPLGDYHLKSQAGRYDPNIGSWFKDDVTSPCIDAGNPESPIDLEPFPNGGIINLGAYGGTAEASKSYFGEPVCETIVAGDINGDCIVNLTDFSIMANHWLEER